MGYRSDVAYVIKFDELAQRDAFITLMHAKNDPHINNALEEIEYRYSKDPIITFQCENTKWYESYPDVDVHHRLMRDAVELYKAEYYFVRMGENDDDVETLQDCDKHNLWDYVYTIRQIGTDFPPVDAA